MLEVNTFHSVTFMSFKFATSPGLSTFRQYIRELWWQTMCSIFSSSRMHGDQTPSILPTFTSLVVSDPGSLDRSDVAETNAVPELHTLVCRVSISFSSAVCVQLQSGMWFKADKAKISIAMATDVPMQAICVYNFEVLRNPPLLQFHGCYVSLPFCGFWCLLWWSDVLQCSFKH